MNYLRADGARKHNRRDLEIAKSEVKDGLIISIHDIHVDQVLGIALLNGDEQLFLPNKKYYKIMCKKDKWTYLTRSQLVADLQESY